MAVFVESSKLPEEFNNLARKYKEETKDFIIKPVRKSNTAVEKVEEKVKSLEGSIKELSLKQSNTSLSIDMIKKDLLDQISEKINENTKAIDEFHAILSKMTSLLDKLTMSDEKVCSSN